MVGGSSGNGPSVSSSERSVWRDPVIIAAIIAGVATVIVALIGIVIAVISRSGGGTAASGGSNLPTSSTSSMAPSSTTPSPSPDASLNGVVEIVDNHTGARLYADPRGDLPSTTVGPIAFGVKVVVQCRAPNISGMGSVTAFYLIASPSEYQGLYAVSDTFANGDTLGDPSGMTNVDLAVPICH